MSWIPVIFCMKSIKRTIFKTVRSSGIGEGRLATTTPMSGVQTPRPRAFRLLPSQVHSLIFWISTTLYTNDLSANFTYQPAMSSLVYLLDRRNSEKKVTGPRLC